MRSLATCAAFLHQLENGGNDPNFGSAAGLSGAAKASVSLAQLFNRTPRSLMEEAVKVLWGDPTSILEHTDSWMPIILSRLSLSDDPNLTRVIVLGQVKQETNVAWNSLFFSPIEVGTLGMQCAKRIPLLGVVVADEIPRLMARVLEGVFKSASKPDERGRLVQYSDVSHICPCVDRYQRIFMGLVRIRQCFMSHGAVVAQTVTCTWLPESRYLCKPHVQTQPYLAQHLGVQQTRPGQAQYPVTIVKPQSVLTEQQQQQWQEQQQQAQQQSTEQPNNSTALPWQQQQQQQHKQHKQQPKQEEPQKQQEDEQQQEEDEQQQHEQQQQQQQQQHHHHHHQIPNPIMPTWPEVKTQIQGLEDYQGIIKKHCEDLIEVLL